MSQNSSVTERKKPMRKVALLSSLVVVALLAGSPALVALAASFPHIVPLPNGFRPEGIASGYGSDLYAGSLATGAIYKADARTGQGAILVPGQVGRSAAGLSFDERTGYLYVAGASTGMAYVYDTRSGEQVAALLLAGAGNFVNDVVVTRSAAYFTSSREPVLYKVPLLPNGRLPDPVQVEALALTGDWIQVPDQFNANGIDAPPDGNVLIVVNSNLGNLYRVDPNTGVATLIDLGGATVTRGDGLLLDGKTLYVVRNFFNEIAIVQLSAHLDSGTIVGTITDPAFRIPTTIAEHGKWLYAVNARFDVPDPGPDTEYEIVRVRKG
jgi:sugar lactone lactonase YvrE